jgi:NDP-sugar pyrophosphorylase family protein
MIEQAVILAAGRGSRVGALTENRNKAMLPVLGKPIMVRVMDRLREAGIKRFVVVIGSQDGGLASYLSSSWYPHLEVQFVLQPVPKGTADALSLAANYIDGDFLLSSVDNLTPPDHVPNLIRCLHETDADFVLSLLETDVDDIKASAEAIIDGDIVVDIVEKPVNPVGNAASIMLYACKHHFLKYLPSVIPSARGERELISAVQTLIQDGGHVAYVFADYRYHLSHDADLLMINKSYLEEERDSHILSELDGSINVIPPIRIDPGVRVGNNARIGPYVYLEAGCKVGIGATLSNTVVLHDGIIRDHETCENQIVTGTQRISVSIPY